MPPTDYDAPYSAMPITVTLKKVKQKVKNSYIKMAKEKAKEMSEKLKYKPGIKKATLPTKKGAAGAAADKKDFKWTKISVVVDSGAVEHVLPEKWIPCVAMVESPGSKAGKKYLSATGQEIRNLGQKSIVCKTKEGQSRGPCVPSVSSAEAAHVRG